MSYRFNCIVCGKPNDGNHHCSDKTINYVEAARKSAPVRFDRGPSYGDRIDDGFFQIDDGYLDDSV